MRGTKLTAWRVPPLWNDLLAGEVAPPSGSSVLKNQRALIAAARETLEAIAADVRAGLLETVGVGSRLIVGERCSVALELPAGADVELIARAIDQENVEAWTDETNVVHVGINPWYSTKDVDQTVLSTIKVIHVLLGIHACDFAPEAPQNRLQKLLTALTDVLQAQKNAKAK